MVFTSKSHFLTELFNTLLRLVEDMEIKDTIPEPITVTKKANTTIIVNHLISLFLVLYFFFINNNYFINHNHTQIISIKTLISRRIFFKVLNHNRLYLAFFNKSGVNLIS